MLILARPSRIVFLDAFGSLSGYSHLGTLLASLFSGTFVVPHLGMCYWSHAKRSPVFGSPFSSCVLLTRSVLHVCFVPLDLWIILVRARASIVSDILHVL